MLINKEYLQTCEPHEIEKNKKLKLLYWLPRWLRAGTCSAILRMVLKKPFQVTYCSPLDWGLHYQIDPSAYKNKISLAFEGAFLSAPEGFDHILTTLYGDYMTPPPESERHFGHEGAHGKIIYDHTRDYREYLAQLRG